MATNDHDSHEIDELSGTQTTGHEWDGIKELDTPMPRWWVRTFYATIVIAFCYVIYYPAIPLIETSTVGVSGVTARGTVEEKLAAVKRDKSKLDVKLANTALENVRNDDQLYRYAVAGGESLYKVYCTQCHGSGAQGAVGYPNLNDDDWLWGGDLDAIRTTIAHGVRNDADDDTRLSMMPSFGRDGILSNTEISSVVEYVLKMSAKDHNPKRAIDGKAIFAENCASCHGDDGLGNRDLGAPNLADALALYGNDRQSLTRQIIAPRHGVMPPWLKRLGEPKVRQLAFYIHSLGGGETAK
ncbi:MAG: cytochrome-c oxidase, cbb3-type subunit III [Hyphomicrobiaceae bacterium]|nr:cytochrome-c oxidase, cbb3-type subunit III [Hyphomicrobiaceae bacterium]